MNTTMMTGEVGRCGIVANQTHSVAGQEVGHLRQWATGFETLDSVHMVLLGG